MKIFNLICLVFFLSLSINAQISYYSEALPDFEKGEVDTCFLASDPEFVYPFTFWEIYQTENDKYDGARLNTCIEPIDSSEIPRIKFSNAIENKTIFIRAKLEQFDSDFQFEPNEIYTIENAADYDDAWITANNSISLKDTCADGMCSGIRMHIEIPDSNYYDTTFREYDFGLDSLYIDWQGQYFYFFGNCFPTEKFNSVNRISEFIIKLTLFEASNDTLIIPELSIYGYLQTNKIFEMPVAIENDTAYYAYLNPLPFWKDNNLVMYLGDYPSPDDIYFHEINLENNSYEQESIYLEFSGASSKSLIFQPYTEIVGGWNIDSTLRHQLSWINDGARYCFTGYVVERKFENREYYIHKSGGFDFQNNSCFMFGNGGGLIVAENAKMEYGLNGRGILMFKTGAQIKIEKNASLIIGNKLMLQEYEGAVEPRTIRMELNQGSHLAFTKTATIDNSYSINQCMQLEILMKGGTIDLDQLDLESRSKIKLIYPGNEEISPIENIENVFLQNNQLFFGADAFENTAASIQIFNLNGQRLWSETFSFQAGYVEYKFNIPPSIANGIYLYSINNQTGNTIQSGSLLSGL